MGAGVRGGQSTRAALTVKLRQRTELAEDALSPQGHGVPKPGTQTRRRGLRLGPSLEQQQDCESV